jgi:hypothetical protein
MALDPPDAQARRAQQLPAAFDPDFRVYEGVLARAHGGVHRPRLSSKPLGETRRRLQGGGARRRRGEPEPRLGTVPRMCAREAPDRFVPACGVRLG